MAPTRSGAPRPSVGAATSGLRQAPRAWVPSLGVGALVALIVAGTAAALWLYLSGPVASAGPAPPRPERDAEPGGREITREAGSGRQRISG